MKRVIVSSVIMLLVFAGVASAAQAATQVGQSRTVKDLDGNKMRVTLVQYVANYRHYGQFDTPKPGTRYVGVRMKIKNLSNGRISECDDNDIQLATPNGTNIGDVAIISATTSCYELLPGRTVYSWTFVSVGKRAKIAIVDLIPGSQNSSTVGEWKV